MVREQAPSARRSLPLLIFSAALAVPAIAQAQEAPPTIRVTPDCSSAEGDELVVCGRRGRSPFRLPEAPQAFDPGGLVDSISRERHRLLDVGASGINSCSTSGPGGSTGCDLIRWKNAQEQWAGKQKEPKLSIGVGPLKKTIIE